MNNNPAQVKPALQYPGMVDEIIRTIIFMIVVTVLFDMAIPRSLVDGRSMQPTFEDEERLIVSRVHLFFTAPDRGDIIVFNSVNPRDPDSMLIKRVIGLPGDTVSFLEQQLSINGIQIDEPYIREECSRVDCPDAEWVLAEDEYFVMGDNRNNSQDSRDGGIGPIPLDHIVGQVIFRYWPPERIGILDDPSYEALNPQ